ncbi:MAG: hypothetical protein LBT02_03160, partial [Rickettsiales bacterium]|nr:hypothetical protein [Rickettsiales bacterium]
MIETEDELKKKRLLAEESIRVAATKDAGVDTILSDPEFIKYDRILTDDQTHALVRGGEIRDDLNDRGRGADNGYEEENRNSFEGYKHGRERYNNNFYKLLKNLGYTDRKCNNRLDTIIGREEKGGVTTSRVVSHTIHETKEISVLRTLSNVSGGVQPNKTTREDFMELLAAEVTNENIDTTKPLIMMQTFASGSHVFTHGIKIEKFDATMIKDLKVIGKIFLEIANSLAKKIEEIDANEKAEKTANPKEIKRIEANATKLREDAKKKAKDAASEIRGKKDYENAMAKLSRIGNTIDLDSQHADNTGHYEQEGSTCAVHATRAAALLVTCKGDVKKTKDAIRLRRHTEIAEAEAIRSKTGTTPPSRKVIEAAAQAIKQGETIEEAAELIMEGKTVEEIERGVKSRRKIAAEKTAEKKAADSKKIEEEKTLKARESFVNSLPPELIENASVLEESGYLKFAKAYIGIFSNSYGNEISIFVKGGSNSYQDFELVKFYKTEEKATVLKRLQPFIKAGIFLEEDITNALAGYYQQKERNLVANLPRYVSPVGVAPSTAKPPVAAPSKPASASASKPTEARTPPAPPKLIPVPRVTPVQKSAPPKISLTPAPSTSPAAPSKSIVVAKSDVSAPEPGAELTTRATTEATEATRATTSVVSKSTAESKTPTPTLTSAAPSAPSTLSKGATAKAEPSKPATEPVKEPTLAAPTPTPPAPSITSKPTVDSTLIENKRNFINDLRLANNAALKGG